MTSQKTSQKTRRGPAPLYAAAGAGDLAYEKLRTLPKKVTRLRARVGELSPTVRERVAEHDVRDGLNRLRVIARRNAKNLVESAHQAQARAAVVYGDLVARGEVVVEAARAAKRAKEAGSDGPPQPSALTAEEPTVALTAASDQPEERRD